MGKLEREYIRFIEEFIKEHSDDVFRYRIPVSSVDSELRIIGREGFRIELKDERDRRFYLSLDNLILKYKLASEDNI